MRALVLDDWWQLSVTRRPDPEVGADEVLIRVVATGICGSDLHGFTGENGRRRPGQVMGHETVGRIVGLGDAASGNGLNVGSVVTVNPVIGCGHCAHCRAGSPQACANKELIGVTPGRVAAFAELLVAPAENVVTLPDQMPIEYGALIEPLAVGYRAIRRAPVAAGDTVFVVGGGPIGQACVLAAFREGARAVVVSERDAERGRRAESLGALTVRPGDDLARLVVDRIGEPPSVVVDAVGSDQSTRDALACAAPGAPVVLVGMAAPHLAVSAYDISTAERSLIGSFCYTPAEFSDTAAWVGTAPSALDRLIDGHVDLDGAPDAFTRLARGEWSASKVLVHPNGR